MHKQVYIYGSLDFSPTVIDRKFGLTWSVGGYLLTHALARWGGEAIGRMRARVLAEAKTTFASRYAHTIGLREILQPRSSPSSRAAALGRSTSSTHRATAQPDELLAKPRRQEFCHRPDAPSRQPHRVEPGAGEI